MPKVFVTTVGKSIIPYILTRLPAASVSNPVNIHEYVFWTVHAIYPCTLTLGFPVLAPISADEWETAERQWGLIAGTKVELVGNLIYILPPTGTWWETTKEINIYTFFCPTFKLFWVPKTAKLKSVTVPLNYNHLLVAPTVCVTVYFHLPAKKL